MTTADLVDQLGGVKLPLGPTLFFCFDPKRAAFTTPFGHPNWPSSASFGEVVTTEAGGPKGNPTNNVQLDLVYKYMQGEGLAARVLLWPHLLRKRFSEWGPRAVPLAAGSQ